MRESSQAQRAFSDYLAQTPPRSLERLAQTYQAQTKGRPPTRLLSTLKEWSRQHDWQERIAAHERTLAQERAAEDAAEEAQRRKQAREARLGIAANVMSESYKQFMARAKDGKLTPYAALQALTLAFETQRKDLHEPDHRVEVSGPGGGKVPIEHSYDADGAPDVLAILASAGVLAFPARSRDGGGAAGGDDDPPAAALRPVPPDS